MRPAAARRVVAASGVLVAAAAAAGLLVFGGPGASRSVDRDGRRLADLQTIAEALVCHAEAGAPPAGAPPAAPASLAEVSPACLWPGRVAGLVDPATGAPYALDRATPGVARVCAAFERPGAAPRWAPPSFDAPTGCLAALLPRQPAD